MPTEATRLAAIQEKVEAGHLRGKPLGVPPLRPEELGKGDYGRAAHTLNLGVIRA